jgi:hypothetical protein
MSRAATFKQADVSRAIKGAEDVGKSVAAVDIRRSQALTLVARLRPHTI